MKLIQEEKLNKRIEKEFKYDFEIEKEGLYVIEISARAKSWLQNTLKLISFFKDDDLALKIDGIEFPKLSGKRGLFDSEAAWNGNKLKNFQQINIFFIYLNVGKHFLRLIVDHLPYLETIKIYQTAGEKNIVFEPSKNYQMESGNGRPWLKFILVNLSLKKLRVEARANYTQRDDDDLQLRIDTQRQTNKTPKSHKYWYWCGRALKGQSRVFDQDLNLAPGLHYIELWVDNAPSVNRVAFELEKKDKEDKDVVGQIAIYEDVIVGVEEVYLRFQPSDQSEVLAKIPNKERIIILTKAVRGNRPEGLLSDLWHKVLYRGKKGFVHSSLIEIKGQERSVIVEKIKTKARELKLDEGLAFNLAYCESKWLPFARSKTDNKGVYQLGMETIKEINQKYGGNIINPWDIYQNIDGGLRYFKYLLGRYTGVSDYLIRVIAAWNAGPNAIPKTGPLNLKNYDPQVQELVNCILKERRGENVLKYLKLFILPLLMGIGFWVFFSSDHYKNLYAEEKYLALVAQQEINYLTEGKNFVAVNPAEAREKEVVLGFLQTDIDGNQKLEKITFAFYSPEPFFYYTRIYSPSGEKITIDGSLWKAFVDDLTGDGIKELIVKTITGQVSETSIFEYQSGSLKKIPIYDETGIESRRAALATSKEVYFEDLDNDGIKEIVLPIRNYGNEFIEPTYYYRWNGKGFMLYDQKDIIFPPFNG